MIVGIILAFIWGTILGSFLNVVIWRLPREQGLNGRSHCPKCRHILGPQDLFPLFSYLFLKGKCRYCGHKISSRYFKIELITGLLFAIAYVTFLPVSSAATILLLRALFIICVLVVTLMIDYEHFLILDNVTFIAAGLLFAINLLADTYLRSPLLSSYSFVGVLSGTILMGIFAAIFYGSKGKWIGFGDVKFAFLLGLITPGIFLVLNIFLAFGIGAVAGIFMIMFRKKNMNTEVPFGVFMALSSFAILFWGQQILNWYTDLIGWK